MAPYFPLRLVDKTDAWTNNGYMFPVWLTGIALSAGPAGASATEPISSGVFHHAAVTFNQSTARFFLNGQFVGTGNIGATSVPINSLPLRIGASQGAQANPNANFSGVIDEVRVYNRTLSDVEVAALATAPATVNGTCGTADGVAVSTRTNRKPMRHRHRKLHHPNRPRPVELDVQWQRGRDECEL